MIKLTLVAMISLSSVVLGFVNPASEQFSGTVKWNGNISTPRYLWKLNGENAIIFCPTVTCDAPSDTCDAVVTHPTPSGSWNHYCSCGFSAGAVCTTLVVSDSQWGPISSVRCISLSCSFPLACSLLAQGNPDPNGYYEVKCECK